MKKMNAKNVILTLAIFITLFLIAAVGSASAKDCGIGIADCDCGDTVVANWALTGNMFCPAGNGLIVASDNIIIDGAGYTIHGIEPGDCGSRAGIYSQGYDNVTIKNLKIENFCNGIYLEGTTGNVVDRNTIHNCEVYDNGIDTVDAGTMGMRLIYVDNSTISNNNVHDTKGKGDGCESGGNGIYIFAGDWNLVTNNSLYDNIKSGYFTKYIPQYTNVTHNDIWGNGEGGITLMCVRCEYHTIEHNRVTQNNGWGILTNGAPNTIRYNTVTYNAGTGINMAGGTLNSNTVCGNGGTDIHAQSAGSVTGDDDTCDTTSNYNDDGTTGCTWQCPTDPDLVIVNKGEDWVVEGLSYNLTYTVKNYGKTNANPSTTCIYIDGVLNTADDVPELAASANYTNELGPFTISECKDTIEVCADCEDNVTESWENNNCKTNKFVSEPDLVITEKTEEWVVEGYTYNITYTVKNVGTATASTSKTGIYIDDVLNTTDDVPELEAGASYTSTLGPFSLSEYVDTIKLCADYDYNVSESMDSNNCITNVFGVADLVIAEKKEEWIVEGSTYNLTYTVANIGFAGASASKTGIYIDGIFYTTDDVPELGPGDSYTSTVGPFTMSGNSDTIKVCADNDSNVLEIDEENNCMTNVFRVFIYVNTSGWWRVGGPFNPSPSPIQAAVNNAVAEDTIVVKDGTYTENVNVNTAHLTIQSENGSANCVVQTPDSSAHVFDVHGSYTNIAGFTVTGAGASGACGIRISGDHPYCKMTNNNISDNYYGVYMDTGSVTYVYNCPDLINNTISNNHYGVYIISNHYRWGTRIENNTISSNDYGIYITSSYYLFDLVIEHNVVCENVNVDIHRSGGNVHVTGDNNTCSSTSGYNDEGTTGCTWKCLPDLVIVEKTEQWVVEGSTYSLTYTLENTGTSMANASKTCIYIDGVLNATDDVPELEAVDNHTATLGPFSLSEGNDTIKVCADCEDNVTECEENNNCLENVFGRGCLAEDGTIFFCGDTVTKSCMFQGDMSCANAGLIIGAENIAIDGNGYKITGSATPANCEWASETAPCTVSGIYNAGYDGVVIKNLVIENFCTGIALHGTGANKVRNNTINNCSIHDNGFSTGGDMTTHGIHACWIEMGAGGEPGLTITNNDIYNNEGTGAACGAGGNGIFIYAGSPEGKHEYCNISYNKLHGNAKAGFWTKMMLTKSEIAHNEIYENGYGTGVTDTERGGIILRCKKSSLNNISYNKVYDNDIDGMYIGGGNNLIRNNTVTNNTDDGIDMGRSDGSFNNELYDNTVCENGDKDISTFGNESNTIGVNNTCDTTKDYGDTGVTGCTYACGGAFADFSADPTKGAAPLTVNFTDKSRPEGSIISWSWDFDDDGVADSTTQNPTHTYSTAVPYSYYNISLTVNWTGEVSAKETKTEYIKVWKPDAAPDADFHCEPGVGTTTEPVEFTDKSIGEVNAGSWLWDFGDGNTSTEQNPVYYYSEEGIYNVSLTVTGPGGTSKDTKIQCVRVGWPEGGSEKRPLIDAHFFASTRTSFAPFTVQFTDMSMSEGNLTSWLWDFGDGNMSDERNPVHTYASPGTYNVSIETISTTGAKTRETKTGYISVLSCEYVPTTPFVINGRTFNAEGGELNNCTVTIENLNTSANWTAKTSAMTNYYRLVLDSDDVSAGDTLRFNAEDTAETQFNTTDHTITQDELNSGVLLNFNITLSEAVNQPPVVDPNGPYEGTEGVSITFDGSGSYDPDGTIELYEWDFGDGNNGTGVSPAHTYVQNGTYTVTLIVTDNRGATDVNTTTATITEGVEEVDNVTTADIPVKGTVTGAHEDTYDSDNVYESITERESGGKPVNRYSYLEHKWTIDVISGNKTSVTFHLEANCTDRGDGDEFKFEYSTDETTGYEYMVTVNTTTDTNLSCKLQSNLSGIVYIRVRDTDRNRGNNALDTISIDCMFIRSVSGTSESDTMSPAITDATGDTSSTTGEPKTISATITDNVDVVSVAVHYTPIDGTETTVPMTEGAGDVWSADVPVASDKVGTITYYITAEDAVPNTARDPATGTYSITVTDNDAPSPISDLSATAVAGGDIELAWSAASDNIGVVSYEVYRKLSEITNVTGLTPIANTSGTTYTDTTGVEGTTYYYAVTAVDAAGNEADASNSPSATPDAAAPAISAVSSSDVTSTSATITWTTDEASDSVVNYGTTISLGSTGSNPAMVTSHSVMLTGLSPETTYYYEVQSMDAAGNTATDNNGGAYYTFTTTTAPTNTMHIAGIDMSTTKYLDKGWYTYATATVTVVNSTGAPVEGATVNGTWSELTSDTDSGLTNSTGQVSLDSDPVKNAAGTFNFTVDIVAKDGWTWDGVEKSNSTTVP